MTPTPEHPLIVAERGRERGQFGGSGYLRSKCFRNGKTVLTINGNRLQLQYKT